MARESFPPEVQSELGLYVYRLVDPRNGETFYVGKGRGNRVFTHALGELEEREDIDSGPADPKVQRINEIKAAGLEVSHVIHRHGLSSDKTALEVEAALIDAYPGLTNRQAGQGSNDRGCRHVEEICAYFEAEPFAVKVPLILIAINKLWRDLGTYEAVQCAWKIQTERAKHYDLVLAHVHGVVRGVYQPKEWLRATRLNFPQLKEDFPGKVGFYGDPADKSVWNEYFGKRVPDIYKKKGAQNAIRYCLPAASP